MKKINNYISPILRIALICSIFLLSERSFAQSCQQVEIKYEEADCFKRDKDGAGTQPDRKDCPEVGVCVNQLYNYSANGVWATYNWSVTGPAPVTINPNNTSPAINITWPLTGTYTLTLTVTDGLGNTFTTCITVKVADKPVANFSFSPNNVCAGSTISFTNSTTFGGPVAYSWDFGDPPSGANNYSSLVNPTHTYAAAGTYTVTLIAYSFMTVPGGQGHPATIKTCCADTITKTVNIVPGTISIECISTVCAGDTATYTAVGCVNPTWFPPVGGTILSTSGNTVTIIWGNGAVQGQIIAQCPGGCTASVPVPIIPSNPIPIGNLSPCSTAITTYSLPLLPGTFYTWHLDNISTVQNFDTLLSTYPDNNTVWINWNNLPAGTYELTIDLDNKHLCCQSTGKITIIPKGTFSAFFNQTVCQGTAASLSVFPAAGTFNWNVTPTGGVVPFAGSGPTFSPVFNNTGIYFATVTETTSAYCNPPQTVKITVVSTPTPGVINGPATACPGSQLNYSMSTNAPTGFYYSWQITGGAGTFEPGAQPTVNGDNATILWTSLPGTISVTLQRIGFPPCTSTAVILNVALGTIGTISGPLNVCVDQSGNYSLAGGTLPAGEPVQWTINPSNLGTILSGQGTSNPTILWHGQVTGTGPWTAILTASSACGNTSNTVTISRPPIFTLSQSGNICLGGVTLTVNPAGSYTYLWFDNTTGTSTTVTLPGTYTVAITSNSCTIIGSITVNDPFTIQPTQPCLGFCNSGSTNEILGVNVLQPGAGTFTYAWYLGTYPSGALQSTVTNNATSNSYTATSDGNYYVVVTYGSCTKVLPYLVKKICCPDINNPQITNVTRLSCNTYTFTGTATNPGGAPITWNFGDGNSQPGTSGVPVTHTYAGAGVYCVTFCVGPPNPNTANCYGNCDARNVTVPITALFTYTLGCNGCISIQDLSTVISASPTYITYTWDYGDGFITNSVVPPLHCYTIPNTYQVILTINYNDGIFTCSSADTAMVTYTPLSISLNTPVCTGQLVNMFSTPAGFASYAWDFGDGFSSYVSPTTHAYNSPGLDTVILTVVDLLGNTCIDSLPVNVLQGVANCTIQPAYLCPGGATTLTAPTGVGYTYVWEHYVGGLWVAPNPNSVTDSLTVINPGFYHVTITNTNGCICISDSVEVKAVPKPKATIAASPSTHLCGPGMVTLTSTTALPSDTSYWYSGGNYGTVLAMGNVYPAFVSGNTTFNLIVINQYGCSDTCSLTVFVHPIPLPPTISSNPGGTLCEGSPITLTVTNYTGNISWNTGANTLSITVVAAGVYTATYTDPVTGCSNSSSITVNSRPPTALFPHFCDSIPCHCIRPFSIYAPLPLIGVFASTYSIQWYNPTLSITGPVFTPAVTGTYWVVITDLATNCSDTSDTYSIIVPPCDTCDCKESMWGDIVLTPGDNDGIAANAIIDPPLVVKCDSLYNIQCNKPYTITAKYICKDTSCPSKVTYSLQPPTGPAITGTAPVNFFTNQSGLYTLTLYGWCGNKICDSCTIKFKVTCPPLCDCAESHWGEIVLGPGVVDTVHENAIIDPPKVLGCGSTVALTCNTSYSLTANYVCKDSTCPSKVTYSLQPPTGPAITGTAPVNFTPTVSGTYTLTLYGWCGNKICDSCIIKFTVKCCDCSKSNWGNISLAAGHNDDVAGFVIDQVPGNPQTIKCNKSYVLKCNKTYSLNATFNCKDTSCPPKVTYSLQPPTGPAITGTVPFTFTPTQNGLYTLTLYGWCGNKICDSCVIKFDVACPPLCDCEKSKWGDILLGAGGHDDGVNAAIIDPAPGKPQVLKCNKTYVLGCNISYSLSASFICNDPFSCPPKVTYSLQPPTGPAITGLAPLNFTPTQNGLYTLTLYGWCGNKICDSCIIKFDVVCPPICDCKNSKWLEITLKTDPALTKVIKCNSVNDVKCNQPFTLNAFYQCSVSNCPPSVTYALTPPTGPVLTGSLPLTYTPTATGTYTVVLYAWCGNKICDSCVIKFRVECPPVPCCPNEHAIVVNQTGSTITQQTNGVNNYSLYSSGFSISGGTQLYQEIKATVLDYQLYANYEECIACKNRPFTWSSISGSSFAGITPTTTGATPTVGFNIPANPTENPREIVWYNGAPINLSTPQTAVINLYLPPANNIPCCELSAKVCIKFSFKDINCKVCEKIICFTTKIVKPTGIPDTNPAITQMLR